MDQYPGNEDNFNSSIYIFEPTDFVVGDSNGIEGTSNVPIKQLADNTAYLKKFKGHLLRGTGDPTAGNLVGISTDSNILENTLYLDENTGNFWKPTSEDGSSWDNIYTSAKLNVNGLRINDSGDETDFLELRYNGTSKQIELVDKFGNFADLRVGSLKFNGIDGSTSTSSQILDDEIILLSEITNQSENSDGFFSVKNLQDISSITITSFEESSGGTGSTEDKWNITFSPGSTGEILSDVLSVGDRIQVKGFTENTGQVINGFYEITEIVDEMETGFQTGDSVHFKTSRSFGSINAGLYDSSNGTGSLSIDNSAQIRWNTTQGRFELRKRDGSLLSLNVKNLFLNGTPIEFYADRVISSQEEYDRLFNHTDTGSNICFLKNPDDNYLSNIENEYIVVKPKEDGSLEYDQDCTLEIQGSNVRIEFIDGTKLKFTNTGLSIKSLNDTNMVVDSKGTNFLNVLTEDFLRTSGDNEGEEIILENGDIIQTFSDDFVMNKKHTVTSFGKDIRTSWFENTGESFYDETKEINNAAASNIQTTNFLSKHFRIGGSGGSNNILSVYERFDSVVGGNDLHYTTFQRNTTSKQYEQSSVSSDGAGFGIPAGNITEPDIFYDEEAQRIHIVTVNDASNELLQHTWVDVSSSFSVSQGRVVNIETNDGVRDPKVYVSEGIVYISWIDTVNNEIKFRRSTSAGSGSTGYTFSGSSGINLSNTNPSGGSNHSLAVTNDETGLTGKVVIIYQEISDLNGILFDKSGNPAGTETPTTIDATGSTGEISKADILNNTVYCVYSKENAGSLERLKIAELDLTALGSSTLKAVVNSLSGANFSSIDFRINKENTFQFSGGKNIFTVFGFNNSADTGDTPMYIFYTSDLDSWNIRLIEGETSNVNSGNIPVIDDNDAVYISYYNGTDNYILKLYYQFKITVQNTLPGQSNETTLTVSPNALDNINLDIHIDGDDLATTELTNFSNMINSKIKMRWENCDASVGLSGDNKTFNISYEILEEPNTGSLNENEINTNVSEIMFSTFINSIINKLGTGNKNFNSCTNINYIGLIDDNSFIGNGDFDS